MKKPDRGVEPPEYSYHVQHPAPKAQAPRTGKIAPARAGKPGDQAFNKHVRVFVVVALFMIVFLALTVFSIVWTWHVRHTRMTRDIKKDADAGDTGWRSSQSMKTTTLFSTTSEADSIHEAEILARQAELMVEATNYREAVKLYSDAIRVWPGLAPAYPQLGRLHLKMGNDARAQPILERAAELNPAAADIFNDLGVAYLRMNRYEKASPLFRTALTIQPDYGPALFNLSLSLRASGDMAGARKILDQYLLARPDEPRGLKEKAFFVAAEGHYAGALGILEEIMLSSPDFAPAYFDAAATAALMKDPGNALRLLRKAEALTSPASAYLVYQQPAFNEVRLTDTGKIFLRDLVRRAQSGAGSAQATYSRGTPEPMLSEAAE